MKRGVGEVRDLSVKTGGGPNFTNTRWNGGRGYLKREVKWFYERIKRRFIINQT